MGRSEKSRFPANPSKTNPEISNLPTIEGVCTWSERSPIPNAKNRLLQNHENGWLMISGLDTSKNQNSLKMVQ